MSEDLPGHAPQEETARGNSTPPNRIGDAPRAPSAHRGPGYSSAGHTSAEPASASPGVRQMGIVGALRRGSRRLLRAPRQRQRTTWRIGVRTYRAFGTPRELRYACRVLRDPKRAQVSIHDSAWDNITAAFHRFESDEVDGARLCITGGGKSEFVTTDDEGYVRGRVALSQPVGSGWHSLRVAIDRLPYGTASASEFPAECLVPSGQARFGIVSDIDDTVLHSQVKSRLRMLMWSVLHNSYTRLPLPGVSRLYRRLATVGGVEATNPVFYVSSSPWNLYSVLVEFLDSVDLPRGPVLLRDLVLRRGSMWGAMFGHNHSHKEMHIIDIMEMYPDMPFILLGDSGQQDAAIYARVAERFPARVLCAYIRDVGWIEEATLRQAQQVMERSGSTMIVVTDSREIEDHARSRGWIESTSPVSWPAPVSPRS